MKQRPILFNAEMVRAILDGRKTQTRRVIKPQPYPSKVGEGLWGVKTKPSKKAMALINATPDDVKYYCLRWGKYKVGDQLWVRETFRLGYQWDDEGIPKGAWSENNEVKPLVMYEADKKFNHILGLPVFTPGKKRPSIFMPRWASRITLEITGVRVERVREISGKDAQAEGVSHPAYADPKRPDESGAMGAFFEFWNKINAKRGYGWDQNPWCWVIEFRNLDK